MTYANNCHSLQSRFVVDGYCRIQWASESEFRAEVAAEYSEQMEAAGTCSRFLLQLKIQRAAKLRLSMVASPGPLYRSPRAVS